MKQRKNSVIGKTGYRGVTTNGNSFCAQIKVERIKIHIGSFTTPLEAAKAYNKEAKKYFGKKAILNKFN